VSEDRSEGLLVRAEPPGLARQVCELLVGEVHEADGALLLAADPAWAAAINTVLVEKGLRISELCRVEFKERDGSPQRWGGTSRRVRPDSPSSSGCAAAYR
jgi:hypothetical protein